MSELMNGLFKAIAAYLSMGLCIGTVLLIAWSVCKKGGKAIILGIAFFFIGCFLAYIITQPDKMIEIGENFFTTVFEESKEVKKTNE